MRITFVGPGFVGKTTIINRIVNNSFAKIYYPTSNTNMFNLAFNITEESDMKSNYVEVEIVDTFALDHPLLIDNESEKSKYSSIMDMEYEITEEEMSKKLIQIINNEEYYKETSVEAKGKKGVPNPNFSHAIVFVFDLSASESLNTTIDYVKAFITAENSTRDESKLKKKDNMFKPLKFIWGNKLDMKDIKIDKMISK